MPICDPEPRLPFTGEGPPSKAGDICRLEARVAYLEALIACETPGADPDCCEQAYAAYVAAHDACPV